LTLPPYWEEPSEPFIRAPIVVLTAIGLLFFIHLAAALAPEVYRSDLVTQFALIPSRFGALIGQGGDPVAIAAALLTLVTYAFLHDDFMHVVVNCVSLLATATPVARRIGTGRFLAFACTAAVCAALAHVLTHLGSSEPRMGASGVVFAMVGAFARFMFLDPKQPAEWPRGTQPLLTRSALTWALIWTASIMVLGLAQETSGLLARYPDWEGHLGGFYAGLLLFPLFDRNRSWLK
jgi:membrane associated rhomboid family serine protease